MLQNSNFTKDLFIPLVNGLLLENKDFIIEYSELYESERSYLQFRPNSSHPNQETLLHISNTWLNVYTRSDIKEFVSIDRKLNPKFYEMNKIEKLKQALEMQYINRVELNLPEFSSRSFDIAYHITKNLYLEHVDNLLTISGSVDINNDKTKYKHEESKMRLFFLLTLLTVNGMFALESNYNNDVTIDLYRNITKNHKFKYHTDDMRMIKQLKQPFDDVFINSFCESINEYIRNNYNFTNAISARDILDAEFGGLTLLYSDNAIKIIHYLLSSLDNISFKNADVKAYLKKYTMNT